MRTDYEILVLSDDWHGMPFSCKHLLRHFLPDIPILWVNTIGLRSPGLNMYDLKRSYNKFREWFGGINYRQPASPNNLIILNPFQIPYNQFDFIRKINTHKLIQSVNQVRNAKQTKHRVLITTWPFLSGLLGRIGETLSIYYRVDDFSEFPGVPRDHIKRLENELMNKVDLLVASAKSLIPEERADNNSHYLPHGVDYDHFTKYNDNADGLHRILKIPAPRIGFFGVINSWIDLDMVERTAQSHSEWSFVMIGPSQLPESELPSSPNIHYLGPVSYADLPSYAHYFDAAIIPFKINALTAAVNPVKLMEYFALGLPVITTALPEVMKYKEYLGVANDCERFGHAIKSALIGNNHAMSEARRSIAKGFDWKERAQQLRSWIEEALISKVHNGKQR